MLVKLSFARKFKDDKDSFAVVEVTVEADNIRMSQIAVDLDFSPYLLFDLSLLQLTLMEDLQRAEKSSRSLFGQIYATELALTEWFSNLKHPKMELLRLRLLIYWWIRQSLYGTFV